MGIRRKSVFERIVIKTGMSTVTPLFCLLLFISTILLLPAVNAAEILVEKADESYNRTVDRDEEIEYVWRVSNTDNESSVIVEVTVNEPKDGWTCILSEERFILQPASKRNSTNNVTLSVRTASKFDGEEEIHKIVFKTSTTSLTKRATTTLDIPEEEKIVTIWNIEIPLPEQLDNMIGHFLVSFAFWVVIAILSLLLLKKLLPHLTKKTTTEFDDRISHMVSTPLFILIVLYGAVNSLVYLNLPTSLVGKIRIIYDFGVMIIGIWIAFKLFRICLEFIAMRWAQKRVFHIKSMLLPLIDKIGKAILIIVMIMLVLDFFGIDISFLLAGAGLAGLVIAFAAQDTLSNFFAGIFLIMEPKFNTNDMIILDNEVYIVRKIGLRTTQLYNLYQHIDMIIPNQVLASSKIVNLTQPDKKLRMKLKIPVSYDTDIGELERTIEEISEAHPDITTSDPERKPLFYFDKYGGYSLDFILVFWLDNVDRRFVVKHEVLKAIFNKFKKRGIEVPYDQKVISFKNQPSVAGLGGYQTSRTGEMTASKEDRRSGFSDRRRRDAQRTRSGSRSRARRRRRSRR